jgi:hypothetical protein
LNEHGPQVAPAPTSCFDIFPPLSGDNDVTSHFERLSSNDTKIAQRSVRMAIGESVWAVSTRMVVSRVEFWATTLWQSARRHPPPHGISIPAQDERFLILNIVEI